MTISIDDLLTPITADQQVESFLTILEALKLPARSWKPSGVARSILRAVAITYAGLSATMVAAIGGIGFLEKAAGAWLVLHAYWVYGVVAIPATFASGKITLTNTGGGVFSYGARQATFLNPITKVTYVNVNPLTLAANTTLPDIDVEATVAGAGGSSSPGGISQLVTSMLGVTVTNPEAVVGVDAEADADLRARCRNKLGALSVRGVRSAYVYAARSARRADGSPVNINRVSVSSSSSTGQVTVYCASPSGAPSADDLAAVDAAIEANARPDAVTVTVLPAREVPFQRAITVWAQTTPGVSAADVQAAVQKAVTAFIAAYPIGGLLQADTNRSGLFGSGLSSVIGASSPARVIAVEGVAPSDPSDRANFDLAVSLAPGEIATDASTITVQLGDVS